MGVVPVEELVDPAFLASLQPLRITARRVVRGGRHAEHLSKELGSGLEFKDFRPYVPGDDLRAIDWNIYRRLGRVFVRLFEEQQDLPLYLLPDVSKSLVAEGDGVRAKAALRATLALAAISLNQHDRVGIFPFADELRTHERPKSGKNQVLTIARRLADIDFGSTTDLVGALSRFDSMRWRQGLCVVVSDFFDPAGIQAITDRLGRLRHKLLLIQITRPADRIPDFEGDLRLVDCETGDAHDVSVTDSVLQRYRDAYDKYFEELTTFATRRSAGLVRINAEVDIVEQLAAVFEGGAFAA